jgi:UDP-N-acetylmuramoyl-tripeptide--D-alanyl-D-alanine ligase
LLQFQSEGARRHGRRFGRDARAKRRIVVAGKCWNWERLAKNCIARPENILRRKRLTYWSGVRGLAQAMVEVAKRRVHAEFVATPEAAGEWLAREARDGDVVLLKASRGVKLEKALETWKAALRELN